MDPNPQLHADAPIEVVEARTLFRSPSIRRRGAASLRRLGSGRLLMAFLMGTGPEHVNDGAVMLTHSDDDGRTWDEPFPIYAYPGWDSLPLGGLAIIRDDLIQLIVGRVKFDASLGGDEPFAGWFMGATESRDGGASWSDVGPEITLFPQWTELYGASNPHLRSDGKLIWAVMGTLGRDREWQAAVTVSDPEGRAFEPPRRLRRRPVEELRRHGHHPGRRRRVHRGDPRDGREGGLDRLLGRRVPDVARPAARRASARRTSSSTGCATARSCAPTATRTRRGTASASATRWTAARPGRRSASSIRTRQRSISRAACAATRTWSRSATAASRPRCTPTRTRSGRADLQFFILRDQT